LIDGDEFVHPDGGGVSPGPTSYPVLHVMGLQIASEKRRHRWTSARNTQVGLETWRRRKPIDTHQVPKRCGRS
jgi:hypothetical protein